MMRRLEPWLLCAALFACTGEGSDIGPRLEPLPEDSYRLVVKDDAGRGVTSAVVTISGPQPVGDVTDRSGRADFYYRPAGRRLFGVDASWAAAAPGDRLGSLAFAADAQPSNQLPFVVYLPDLAGSAVVPLLPGVLSAPITLDDSGWSGAVLDLPAGTDVDLGSLPSALLSSGSLRADHVPPLRFTDGLPVLATRGIFVDPPIARFQPAGSITLPNDIALPPNGSAVLYRLGPGDGEWRSVSVATADASGATLVSPGGLVGGGLYVAAVPAPSVATIIGRVIQQPLDGETSVLRNMRVRAGQVYGLADGNGNFVLDAVPVSDAAGAPVDATLVLAGGREHRTTIEEFPARGGTAVIDLGTIESRASFATDARVLLIQRGRVAHGRAFAMGSTRTGTGDSGHTDEDGRLYLAGIDSGYAGFLSSAPDPQQLYSVQALEGIVRMDVRRNVDLQLFFARQSWIGSGGGVAVWPVDPVSRAPLDRVHMFRDRGAGDEFLDITKRDQIDREDYGGSHAILTLQTSLEGRTVRSAYEVQSIFSGRIEVPMPRAQRAPLGNFDPFVTVTGDVTGVGAVRSTLATGIVDQDAWLSAALDGRSLAAAAPVRLDPAAGGTAFLLGVPSAGGSVIATTGTDAGGATILRDVAFADDVRLDPGVGHRIDLGTPIPADAGFTAPEALVGLDPRVPPDSFVYDLGIRMPSGRTLDVGRGFDGRGLAQGTDVVFALPALTGRLAGARHLVLWRGEGVSQGVTVRQQAFIPFDSSMRAPIPLLEVPQVDAPTPGATVSAAGFEVRYQLPPDTKYVVTMLRSVDQVEPVQWGVLAPNISTGTRFRRMPRGDEILVPGRYTLEVTAVRLERGTALDQFSQDYQAVVSRWMAIGPATRGVGGMSSVRFEIEIVP